MLKKGTPRRGEDDRHAPITPLAMPRRRKASPCWQALTACAVLAPALAWAAPTHEYDALIALGCIIRGETYHFELVANESGAGVTRLSLDYQIPIANAIITTENMEQAIARQTEKGVDAARVAVEMANLLDELS